MVDVCTAGVFWLTHPLTLGCQITDHKVIRYVCLLDLRTETMCDKSVEHLIKT